AGVVIEQGRTVVVGRGLLYENASGVATMSGPVALERAPEGEGDVVTATADGLAFDLETDRSTLEGNVRVTAGERVSDADTLELDEAAGPATLRGNPASSTEGENVLEGNTLLYSLDSNDVIVQGGVRGTLEIDLD